MIIFLMGTVGSGKSTQAGLLSQKLGAHHLNMGGLLREVADGNNEDAQTVKNLIEKGEFVSDELVTKLVKEYLEGKDKVVMEGFPRTLAQASESGIIPDQVVYINLPDDVSKKRLTARGRIDDTEETIAKRLAIYHKQTEPILEYYRSEGKLIEIDGNRTIPEVAQDIARQVALNV
ncbi:MAG: hypothetical protein A2782_00740 [Candidatus Blackburnbacteria bacterium RIFCSPHIGHO2_01_FULL_43_15b]|uniref:Adenylate kinase n=1 Tax=Candidatus Blackburnbacteria bacterium RIFCSPHIGHO2_01_FULL_43_15b TaxID=1797513 RepID=A0A1G1UYW6_9BACT|nr:MAG: hypothetical protein A2782_00740 [Candidatus Blackburnbacteria bacterium RIFCSPHIGHO2_01_FULL_43_15b]